MHRLKTYAAKRLGVGRNDFGNEEIVVIDVFATVDDGNAADLSTFFKIERRDIEVDDGRNVFGKAGNDDITSCFTQRTALTNTHGFTREFERNANTDFAIGIDAIEVSVEEATGHRVTLNALDHNGVTGIATNEIENDIGTIFGRKNASEVIRVDRRADRINATAIARDRDHTSSTKFAAGAFFASNAGFTFQFEFFHC